MRKTHDILESVGNTVVAIKRQEAPTKQQND
jgi:hypothetical protein